MTLDEAILIAQRIEDDDVVGPVGMAIRVLLKNFLEQREALNYSNGGIG